MLEIGLLFCCKRIIIFLDFMMETLEILILIFVFFTSPTSTYALARAAINGDLVAKVENDDGTKQEAGSSKT